MASRRGWPFLFLWYRLEHDSDGDGNEGRRVTAGANPVVTRLDEGLEARAQRNLDAATDVPSEVILRAGTATAVEACA